MEIYQDRYI